MLAGQEIRVGGGGAGGFGIRYRTDNDWAICTARGNVQSQSQLKWATMERLARTRASESLEATNSNKIVPKKKTMHGDPNALFCYCPQDTRIFSLDSPFHDLTTHHVTTQETRPSSAAPPLPAVTTSSTSNLTAAITSVPPILTRALPFASGPTPVFSSIGR